MDVREKGTAGSSEDMRRLHVRIEELERAGKHSEARYKGLVEQIPAIMYTASLDGDGATSYISPQIEGILGYTPSECREDPGWWREKLHPEDRERVLAEIEACRAGLKPLVCEYRMIARNGRVVWLRDEGMVLRDNAGHPLCLQGIMVDITDRKLAEGQNEILGKMATQLAASADVENMVDAVQEGTSRLLDWDAHYFAVRRPDEDVFRVLHFVDTVDGEKRTFSAHSWAAGELSESLRPLLRGEPVLINREPGESGPAYVRFGDEKSLSASLMFVPVRSGNMVIGILSAQSYLHHRYDDTDLFLLQHVADVVAPALERAYAEDALRESERRFQLAIDAADEGLWDWSIATGKVYRSPRVYTMLDYGINEIGETWDAWEALIHPDDLERCRQAVRKCLNRGAAALEVELRMKTRDGAWRWILDRGKVVEWSPRDEPLRMIGTYSDITERKEVERQVEVLGRIATRLAASADIENMIAVVQEGTRELLTWDAHYFAVRRPDSDTFRILYFMDTLDGRVRKFPAEGIEPINLAPSVRGVLQGEPVLINRPPSVPDPVFHTFGDDNRLSASLMYVPVRAGRTVMGILSAQSYTYYRYGEADLSLLQRVADLVAPALERAYAEEALRRARDELETRVRERTADLARTNELLTREVAERTRAEMELRESEERYRGFAEQFSGIAFRSTFDWRPIFFHGAVERITGYTEAEFMSGAVTLEQVIHPDDLEHRRARASRLRDVCGFGYELDFRLLRRDGRLQWVHECVRNICDASGVPAYVQGVIYDIGDRKRAEEEREQLQAQLRHAQKLEAVGLLAGGISHEFNNLLTVILGNSDRALRARARKVSRAGHITTDALTEIRRAAERAAVLTKQLLTFSRKQNAPHPRPLDITQVIMGVESMLKQAAGERIRLAVVCDPDKHTVMTDIGQVEQAVLNLVINARDAMPEGGDVTVRVAPVFLDEQYANSHVDAKAGPHVMVEVADTGTGMDESVLAHLFEPFFTTKPVGKGTGLGLATVYGIVRQAGGHIMVESRPGQGSTFRLFFPAVQAAVPVEDRPAPEYVGGKETILLCEDDPLLRRLARQTLEDHGYRVLEAGDGAEGVKLAEDYAGTIDLLVTDVVMPRMNGRELAAALKQTIPGIRILFISGYLADASDAEALLDDDLAFLEKPFRPEQFLQFVRGALDRQ